MYVRIKCKYMVILRFLDMNIIFLYNKGEYSVRNKHFKCKKAIEYDWNYIDSFHTQSLSLFMILFSYLPESLRTSDVS